MFVGVFNEKAYIDKMIILKRIEHFVRDVFKTSLEIFFEALKLSPNAQGYVSGSITELILKQHLEANSFEVNRIREKWEGKKHSNHHGDFYFRKNAEPWFVLESKGVKSNSEKWHKLYNYDKLLKFLFNHSDKISWIDEANAIEPQIKEWVDTNLPLFLTDYSSTLYDFEEIKKYKIPSKETTKSQAISALKDFSREEIGGMISKRLAYLMSKIRVLETHFVSGTSKSNERTQATPRKDEFNLISIDIFLRFSEHKFLFANPLQLDSSGADPNHLQQNYIMGFVFTDEEGGEILDLSDEWYSNINDAYQTLEVDNAIIESDMQIDSRNIIVGE